MISYRFGVDDLVRLRFAISPMWELVHSLSTLREGPTAAAHLPWLRRISGRVDGAELRPVAALVGPQGYLPDFLTPPPLGPLASFRDELERVRRTPIEQVVHDMRLFADQTSAEVAAPWLADPELNLARLGDVLERYWSSAVAPSWPRVRGLLEADIAHRAQTLTASGPEALFRDLHDRVRWRNGALSVAVGKTEDVELGGRGLVLIPSAFGSAGPAAITRAPWQPTLVYPARGVAALWERDDASGDGGLARVLGASRTTLLGLLDLPRSTTELAPRAGLSAAATSEHLSALRAAGLVTRRREARRVLYARTPLADELIAGGRSAS